MKIIKLYTGEDGKSHFMEMDCGQEKQQALGVYSKKFPASGIQFRDSEPDLAMNWHNAPQPQYIIYLEGQVEVQASGGETRVFHAGDVLFATDLTGQGHISKVLTQCRSVIVTTE
ncbi:cupin domain-containing protein [Aquicella lusitana]|uniref:Cupin domain n=1 Tax=Aquicella lusitana TaxID=254246 RepID=A0A370GWM5_9COXI|nr:hypothetical protein [Aquicella lusitana]RDI48078.1 hypothetical protein C8D86_10343 [Aquicella lusitana]VVC72906.1 hypothetical protein AQULUS_06300 [Aquicella lusitana]